MPSSVVDAMTPVLNNKYDSVAEVVSISLEKDKILAKTKLIEPYGIINPDVFMGEQYLSFDKKSRHERTLERLKKLEFKNIFDMDPPLKGKIEVQCSFNPLVKIVDKSQCDMFLRPGDRKAVREIINRLFELPLEMFLGGDVLRNAASSAKFYKSVDLLAVGPLDTIYYVEDIFSPNHGRDTEIKKHFRIFNRWNEGFSRRFPLWDSEFFYVLQKRSTAFQYTPINLCLKTDASFDRMPKVYLKPTDSQ